MGVRKTNPQAAHELFSFYFPKISETLLRQNDRNSSCQRQQLKIKVAMELHLYFQ